MLEINDLYVGYYKDLNILQGVSLRARQAQITAVLGPNGVGKSTLLKSIFGFVKPQQGQVRFAGQDIVGTPAHRLVRSHRSASVCANKPPAHFAEDIDVPPLVT